MKQSITMTPEFWQAVEDYRQEHGLKTWSQAVLELASKSLDRDTPLPQWGGARLGAGRPEKEDSGD